MEKLIQNDGKLYFIEDFIPEKEAWDYHVRLFNGLDWHEEQLYVDNKLVTVPHLVCWYGDPWADYVYRGVTHQSRPWLPLLDELKLRVEEQVEKIFNGLLARQYRDQNDFMNWTVADEPGLGPEPTIVLLSFGERRLYRARNNNTAATHEVTMMNGSLLVMAGEFQQHWRHCLSRSTAAKGNTIHLSFRNIVSV